MSATPGSHGAPPPANPVLSAYETFVRETPLVTRYTLTTLFTTYCLSWFINPALAVANIPLFTIFQFELYRIVLSPLVCASILSLLFAFLSFTDSGKRLEFSMGSTAFAFLMLTVGGVTNLSFLALCIVFYYLTGNEAWLLRSSSGIWTILLGLIAIECAKAPPDTKRRIFGLEIPTVYYPLAILGLWTLLGGFDYAYLLSVGVGYAYGYGRLDRLKVSNSRFSAWEEGILRNFTARPGWVVGHAATGSDAWLPLNNPQAQQGGGGWSPASLFSGNRQTTDQSGGRAGGGTVASLPADGRAAAGPGNAQPPSEPAKAAFPKGGGRTLGGPSRRPTAEARAAMLEAAEKRTTADEQEGDQV